MNECVGPGLRRARPGYADGVRRLYRLTIPRAIKTKRAKSEIRVRTPQTTVTLLLRKALSSRLKRRRRSSTRILARTRKAGAPAKLGPRPEQLHAGGR